MSSFTLDLDGTVSDESTHTVIWIATYAAGTESSETWTQQIGMEGRRTADEIGQHFANNWPHDPPKVQQGSSDDKVEFLDGTFKLVSSRLGVEKEITSTSVEVAPGLQASKA
jgi:hypothetical protein